MSISAIVLKIASRCNLACRYCYMYQHADQSYLRQPKLISDDVYERTLGAMRDDCRRRPAPATMGLVYHGGEPTLVGAKRFDHLARRAREVLGPHLSGLSLQTNALLLDDEWIDVFERHDVRVNVSLDGPPELHDAERVDHRGRGSHERTVAGLRRLIEAGMRPKVLCVVNPGQSGRAAYRHLRSLGIESMDFLIPDATHDSKDDWYGGFGSTPVADYLIGAFDAWFEEDDPTVDVRIFTDLIRTFLGDGPGSDAFGNPKLGYLVVNTDGAIEAMDALRVCEEGIASSGLNVLHHGFDQLATALPLVDRALRGGFDLASPCTRCPERDTCAGGHLPHRYSRARGFDNPSVWCADILEIFSHIRRRTGLASSLGMELRRAG